LAEQVPTVLCVDDDPAVLEVLTEYLAAEGFNVITARNGVEAFLQVWRRRPRAVVLDLFMPRLGGLDALDSIRRLDASIVIILISGVEGVLEMIREAGVRVAGVFPKPLNLAQLTEGLARAGVVPVGKPAAAPKERPPSRRRVLVVDDEPEAREVLREYLKEKGFDTLAVASGEEALAEVPNFRPDVVLLDISMPRMTGARLSRSDAGAAEGRRDGGQIQGLGEHPAHVQSRGPHPLEKIRQPADDDDRDLRIKLFDTAQRVQPAQSGHLQVEENRARPVAPHLDERL